MVKNLKAVIVKCKELATSLSNSGIDHFTKKVTSWYIKHILVGSARQLHIVSMRKWNRDLAHVLNVRGNTIQPVCWIHNFRKMKIWPDKFNTLFCIHILFIIIFRKSTNQPTNCWRKKCKPFLKNRETMVIPRSVKTWLTLEKLHKSYHSIEHPHMQSARTVWLKLFWSLRRFFAFLPFTKAIAK